MEYGKILKRSIEIVWRHKVLWIFGIVATLFSGGGFSGGFQPNMQYNLGQGDLEQFQRNMPWWPNGGAQPFGNWDAAIPAILTILVVLLIIALALAVVAAIAQYISLGALIGMVDEVEREGDTRFRSGLKQGWRRFLWLLAIDLLVSIAVTIVVFVLMAVVVALIIGGVLVGRSVIVPANMGMGAGETLAIIAIVGVALAFLAGIVLVGLVLSLLVTVVREYAFRAVILDGRGVFQAIGDAFRLFRGRFRESLFTWLLLVAVEFGVGLLTLPLVILGGAAVAVPFALALAATEALSVALLAALPGGLLFVAFAVLFGGVYFAFHSAVWTLAYRELRN